MEMNKEEREIIKFNLSHMKGGGDENENIDSV